MGRVTVALDFRALDARAERGLREVAAQVGQTTQSLIGARRWAWPNLTERENGTVAGLRRDIVDTGALRDSQSEAVRTGPHAYEITWDAPYAAATFLGAVFRKRSGSLPARNAPLLAARQVNLASAFRRGWGGG